MAASGRSSQDRPRIDYQLIVATTMLVLVICSTGGWTVAQEPNAGPRVSENKPERSTAPPPSNDTVSPSEDFETMRRIQITAVVFATVIAWISISFMYFRLNHATRGIYSRRLLLFASLTAVVVLLLAATAVTYLWPE